MRLTFLGTGTSFGVPQIGCGCAVCRSPDPRDKRTRSGAFLETDAGAHLLIDTPPELRLQCVAAGISHLDAVLFTHEHADHIHGIDDLRSFSMQQGAPIPLYGQRATLDVLHERFPYIVRDGYESLPGTTRPEGRAIAITPGEPFTVQGTSILPIAVPHGSTPVVGFRVGALGYITDAKRLDDGALAALAGVRVLVLNALLRKPHPTHLSIDEAVATAQRVGAERTFFTHLTHHQSHADLAAELPPGIAPAYDGLVVDCPAT
ncbi:MAG: MBL fold metallo-hydrolase [Gemmatimonadetes bacterium]|nr:MBL fold metallo-hydrolase [Gemmatimonadota bacterium]